jgi:hypothetical protein
MRAFVWIVCLLLRCLGVCLAIFMIIGSPLSGFVFHVQPDAEVFISRWPTALYLFGWFLLPYSLVRPKAAWGVLFLGLIVASAILVESAISIFKFYGARQSSGRETALFLISLSAFACVVQPLSVVLARYLRRTREEPNHFPQPPLRAAD